MRTATVTLLALTLLPLALTAGPPAAAHHMPETNTWIGTGNTGSVQTAVCIVGRPGIGGACLSIPRPVPEQNVDVLIAVSDFILGPVAFHWDGYQDNGSPCNPVRGGDVTTGAVMKSFAPGCTHVRVFPRLGYAAGTASVTLA